MINQMLGDVVQRHGLEADHVDRTVLLLAIQEGLSILASNVEESS